MLRFVGIFTILLASIAMLIAAACAGAATFMTIEWENPYEHQRLRARFDADDAQAAELAALMRALAQVSTAAQWKVTGMRTAGHPPDQPPSSRVFDSA